MISVRINGKQVDLAEPTPLLKYLEQIGIDPRAIAVEHNGVILQRDLYATSTLRDFDTVEIVRMVGGGAATTP